MNKREGRRRERLKATGVILVIVAAMVAIDVGAGADTGSEGTAARATVSGLRAIGTVTVPGSRAGVRTAGAKVRVSLPKGRALRQARHGDPAATASHPITQSSSPIPGAAHTTAGTTRTAAPAPTPRITQPANASRPTPATAAPAARSARSIYWGASIGTQFTGEQAPWDMHAVTKFERLTRKPLSIVNWGDMFYSKSFCEGYCAFTPSVFSAVRNHGSIPFLSWTSQPATGAFTDARIAAGSQNSYLRSWAAAAKKWGHPLFLRLDWEMNGSWFPWGAGPNGNTPASYVAMWRHVHNVFDRAGATNVSWVWCPNVDIYHDLTPLSSLYPGDAYVDWTCLDGYNWGTNPAGHRSGWQSFSKIYSSTYHQIADNIAPSKPMIIGEVGSTEDGGSKAAWITDMLSTQLPHNYPKIDGVLWFDRGGAEVAGMDWPIETSPAATDAFANAIANPVYTSNTYNTLAGPKIPPP